MSYQVRMSTEVVKRNLKIMLWGKTATRKTESVLRNFPDCCLIDGEGNGTMCVDNPEIPQFIYIPTKDARVVTEVVGDISTGRLKFSDGRPVQTLVIDSWSVFWGVQQEFANTNAEGRAAKYGYDIETTNATQLDWGLAKRPMKQILNHINNAPIKYVVLIAREKDLYEDKPGSKKKDDQVKTGVQPDVLKGTEYDMNLALHFGFDDAKKWFAEVTKVQGTLGNIMPIGKKFSAVPFADIFAYAASIKTSVSNEKTESQIAGEQSANASHTSKDLVDYAKKKGIDNVQLGAALKANGFTSVDLARWDEMIVVIDGASVAQIASNIA